MRKPAPGRRIPPQIVDEAADWYIELNEGGLDVRAQGEFVKWLRTSPQHVHAFLEISSVWEHTANARSPHTVDELVAIALKESNIVSMQEAARFRSSTTAALPASTPLRRAAIAATILIAMGACFGVWNQFIRGVYSARIGEQRSVRLDDGSTVELNSRSKIRVRLGDRARSVELLEGQALFHVVTKKDQPFVVVTDDARVRAVGTQFDVYRKKGGTTVTVVEGKVAVTSLSQPASAFPELPQQTTRQTSVSASAKASNGFTTPLFLTAGEQLTLTPAAIAQPKRADVAIATAWTRRQIVFENTPLSEVIEEFNRYNTQQMLIVDRALESTRINGVFSSTDPESLLRFLRELPDFNVQESNAEIHISARSGH